jgi:hypothetical protein
LDQIYQELQRGKESGEYLQVKGDSVHGFFTWNLSYIFPMEFAEKKEETPDFSFPPEQKPCAPLQKPVKTKKKAVTPGKYLYI